MSFCPSSSGRTMHPASVCGAREGADTQAVTSRLRSNCRVYPDDACRNQRPQHLESGLQSQELGVGRNASWPNNLCALRNVMPME